MRRSADDHGFTFAELLVSMAVSVMIIGALLGGSVALQRTLRASELYGSSQSDQRRLIDYLARDLRRSIAIAATDAAGLPQTVADETIAVSDRASLVLTLPAYYKSDVPSDARFDQPLPVVTANGSIYYGSSAGPAPGVVVSYRKTFVAEEGCVCFVRQEAEVKQIIVRPAEDLHLRVTVAPDGRSAAVQAWFRSPSHGIRPVVSTYDHVLLRNRRSDRSE